ncbi:hypothetical protein HH304_05550 [Flammeovirgaceae bacterium KN852]|uniref:Uncharacterized protein n=2 Tax=Marinigracilibium pacificum TaxID=2729599 RepID=A0A848IU41_9BACT|nr:hypothetical protein [Marinigracilibium pacificum]
MHKGKVRILSILGIIVALLMIPAIGMQFTDEVNWSLFDFIVMGMLLLVTGVAIELVFRFIKKLDKKLLYIFIILILMVLIWMELAVGIFGTPFAGS